MPNHSKARHQKAVKKARAKRVAARAPVDTYIRPESFPKFTDTIDYAKKAVYSITRIREVKGQTYVVTLGSGFIVGPNKLMTCSHVMKSIDPGVTPTKNPLAYHADGDTYYLLNKDPYDSDHYYRMTGRLGRNVHLYPEVDAAVLTLEDDFYTTGRKILQNRDVFLQLSVSQHPLGTSVAVLGYPEEIDDKKKLSGIYIEQGTNKLVDDLIKKRVDRGVINARYKGQADDVIKYDFTMPFNPGNSGGPIIDDDCNVVALAHGYRAFPIRVLEDQFVKNLPNGTKETVTVPSTLRAIYSIGFAAENFGAIIAEHGMPTA
jgi:hypothetical protein